ncbi:MAG: HlyD family efflux transporter periplasmic adaptor subunit [Lachnospiraceae bacterium]|nr:HlyD family efflux transporter periplasmic adaptor subunit [Lachnospiraceae bacterium]
MQKSKTPKRPRGMKTPEQRRRQGKITTVIIGVLSILSMVALFMVPKLTQTDTTPMVATQEVARQDVTAYLEVSGTVKSLKTKTYYSPVNATVKEYTAKPGQLVSVGTTLVSFDTSTLERDNQKANLTRSATVNTNQDTLDKAYQARAEADVAQGNVQIIQGDIDRYKEFINNLKKSISDRTIQLSKESSISAADAMEEQAQEMAMISQALEYAQQKEDLKAKNSDYQAEIDKLSIEKSQAEFEGDKNTANTISAQIRSRKGSMEGNQILMEELEKMMGDYANVPLSDLKQMAEGMASAGGGSSMGLDTENAASDAQLSQWQLDLENAQTTLAELQSDLAQEEAKVDAADAVEVTAAGRRAMENNNNLAEIESSSLEQILEKGRKGIKAEFNGIVTKAELFAGTEATQGMELVSIASNDDVAVEVTVSKYDYGKLEKGQKAQVTVGNKVYQGTVGDISRVAQQNEKGAPIITCEVNIDNPDNNIFLGVEAKASILTGSVKKVLTVPVEAVNTGKDNTFCYVLADGVIARREVVTGISSDTLTEIQKGLKEGDLVISQLPAGLEEGSAAKSMPAAGGQEGADGADN